MHYEKNIYLSNSTFRFNKGLKLKTFSLIFHVRMSRSLLSRDNACGCHMTIIMRSPWKYCLNRWLIACFPSLIFLSKKLGIDFKYATLYLVKLDNIRHKNHCNLNGYGVYVHVYKNFIYIYIYIYYTKVATPSPSLSVHLLHLLNY